jgi:hypothetical protein
VNKSDFEELAELHLQHAKALLDAQLYSGAYYMCGYVVECALKACICKRTDQYAFYPHPKEAQKAWSHKFKDLISLADIGERIEEDRRADDILDIYWKAVEGWSEGSRYEPRGQKVTEDLLAAVSDPAHGVLSCLRRFW